MEGKILVAGSNGQLGHELQRTVPAGWDFVALDLPVLDITELKMVQKAADEHKPDLIINAAAYTAVDKAEQDVDLSYAVNAAGAANLAAVARDRSIRLIHISTDFVFDGSQSTPYLPTDQAKPLGVYGASKLAGEKKVAEFLPKAVIIRTAWLYSAFGQNFVKTMLRLMNEKEELRVVDDQIGSPTWAHGLAEAVWAAADRSDLQGMFHWADAGLASWYDFAVAIQEEAVKLGLLSKEIPVLPISTTDYPTPAKRPAYSVLDKRSTWKALGVTAPHWRVSLRNMLKDVKDQRDA